MNATRSVSELLAVNYSPSGALIHVLSADGLHLAIANDNQVDVWDWNAGRKVAEIPSRQDAIVCLAFTADGRHVSSGGADGTARTWDWERGTDTPSLRGGDEPTLELVHSPDGHRLSVRDASGVIRVWDWRTATLLEMIEQRTDDSSDLSE